MYVCNVFRWKRLEMTLEENYDKECIFYGLHMCKLEIESVCQYFESFKKCMFYVSMIQ